MSYSGELVSQELVGRLEEVLYVYCKFGEDHSDQPYQELLKEIGIEGEWEGIGHCAVGYVDGEYPKPAKRRDNRVFWVE